MYSVAVVLKNLAEGSKVQSRLLYKAGGKVGRKRRKQRTKMGDVLEVESRLSQTKVKWALVSMMDASCDQTFVGQRQKALVRPWSIWYTVCLL